MLPRPDLSRLKPVPQKPQTAKPQEAPLERLQERL
jgi:hypothetical protein